jgi:hypothetical protein
MIVKGDYGGNKQEWGGGMERVMGVYMIEVHCVYVYIHTHIYT